MLEISRAHNVYMTKKVDIMPVADAPSELRTGYHKFLSELKESKNTCVLLPVIPITTDNNIVKPYEIPTNISVLMRHFTATWKIREKCAPCGQRPVLVLMDILR